MKLRPSEMDSKVIMKYKPPFQGEAASFPGPWNHAATACFFSAETECSSGALHFGAGEKKLVTAGCLRSPWVHRFTVIHA